MSLLTQPRTLIINQRDHQWDWCNLFALSLFFCLRAADWAITQIAVIYCAHFCFLTLNCWPFSGVLHWCWGLQYAAALPINESWHFHHYTGTVWYSLWAFPSKDFIPLFQIWCVLVSHWSGREWQQLHLQWDWPAQHASCTAQWWENSV